MYDFELENQEKINIIVEDVLLKTDKDVEKVSIVITTDRLIILCLPKDIESFRFGKMINYPIVKETIFETKIKNIKKINRGKVFDKYILNDNNYFLINNDEVFDFLEKVINN